MERKRKKPTQEQVDAIRGRDSIEREQRANRMFQEWLEDYRRRTAELRQAAGA